VIVGDVQSGVVVAMATNSSGAGVDLACQRRCQTFRSSQRLFPSASV